MLESAKYIYNQHEGIYKFRATFRSDGGSPAAVWVSLTGYVLG